MISFKEHRREKMLMEDAAVKDTVSDSIKRNDKRKWRKISFGTARNREMISP